VAHVGDSYAEDIVGARATGMQAVLLKRSPAAEAVPDDVTTVSSLAELVPLLD
jgi:FMN phosphatase YigB (HAD superfamily)